MNFYTSITVTQIKMWSINIGHLQGPRNLPHIDSQYAFLGGSYSSDFSHCRETGFACDGTSDEWNRTICPLWSLASFVGHCVCVSHLRYWE